MSSSITSGKSNKNIFKKCSKRLTLGPKMTYFINPEKIHITPWRNQRIKKWKMTTR